MNGNQKKYQISLKGILVFELKSLWFRILFSKKPQFKFGHSDKKLLNLGCGSSRFEGWINADFPSFRQKSKHEWSLDLRFPLNCEDNFWDGVFCEHTIEHLYPDQVARLLQEVFRTLKHGSWLRITVPNLKRYVDYYCGKEVDKRFSSRGTGCEAIRSLTQDYFHVSLWDADLLKRYLNEAGFTEIKEVSFLEGTDPALLKDSESRAWETLYVEAKKN
jgi:predicted SAM-dependent methyltransferase